MSKSSRKKGHEFEREIAWQLRGIFPEARRHLEYHKSDCNGVDLVNTGPYRFQCKRHKKYASVSDIDEIQLKDRKAEIPVLITKADHRPVLAVLPFDALVELIAAAEGRKEERAVG
jgi:hypothetical protein